MSFISIQQATNQIANLSGVNLGTDRPAFHLIHCQILGIQIDPSYKFTNKEILNEISTIGVLTDTRPTENIVFDDFRLVNLNLHRYLLDHPDISLINFNEDIKKQEIAQIYPVQGQYVVPINILSGNMVSAGAPFQIISSRIGLHNIWRQIILIKFINYYIYCHLPHK